MSPVAAMRTVVPLAAASLAILLVAVTGLDQRTPLPPEIEARFYGFFLDRYPLFSFAIVYGLARVVTLAATGGSTTFTTILLRRVLGAGLGCALVLAVSLYPTFGGLVLRAGFATGGMAFLTQQPMPVAYAIGSAAAAFAFGTALGLAGLLIGGQRRPGLGWRRRLVAGATSVVVRFLALWFAFAVIGLARSAGLGPWPHRPLSGADTGIALSLVVAALLPHALLAMLGRSGEQSRRSSADGLIPATGYR